MFLYRLITFTPSITHLLDVSTYLQMWSWWTSLVTLALLIRIPIWVELYQNMNKAWTILFFFWVFSKVCWRVYFSDNIVYMDRTRLQVVYVRRNKLEQVILCLQLGHRNKTEHKVRRNNRCCFTDDLMNALN